jgi:uncharacterized membrane protein YdbT with pleckstrin-like domain
MDTVCSAVFPVADSRRAIAQEVVQIQCRQHWAILIAPACFLAAWLATGFVFVSILTNAFKVFGQEQFTQAPRIMAGMFAGSALLIGLLYWHSYRRSAIHLTNGKVALQTGPLFQGAGEMDLDRAKLVAVQQSALGRLLDYGTVSIVGPGKDRFRLRFIPNPKGFYDRLNRLVVS